MLLAPTATRNQREALAKCLHDNNAAGDCGPCEICQLDQCFPVCLSSCSHCDGDACVDHCPPDQYCSRLGGNAGGGCIPKCPQACAPYDPSTGGCRDTCTAANPCMICHQNQCQSNCPNPADYCQSDGVCRPCDAKKCQTLKDGNCSGCHTTCEKCQNGACVSTCPNDETCCVGRCLTCCGRTCDRTTGVCKGGSECQQGQTCCGMGCVFLSTDSKNCGRCGNVCPAGSLCDQGACTMPCPKGSFACGTAGICCTAAQTCCSSGFCCDPGRTCCTGSQGFDCCVSGSFCCNGHC